MDFLSTTELRHWIPLCAKNWGASLLYTPKFNLQEYYRAFRYAPKVLIRPNNIYTEYVGAQSTKGNVYIVRRRATRLTDETLKKRKRRWGYTKHAKRVDSELLLWMYTRNGSRINISYQSGAKFVDLMEELIEVYEVAPGTIHPFHIDKLIAKGVI